MINKAMKSASLMTAMSIVVTAQAQAPAPTTAPTSSAAPAATAAPPPAVPRARGPSLALAVEAAQVAAATCTANGYKTTVLVVDSAGVPVVVLSGDGAIERTQTVAARKITTLLSYYASSGEVTNPARTAATPAAATATDPKAGPPRQGALLLKADGTTIGAIAVSGAPGADKDEVCAQAAVDKIKDRLR